MADRYDMHVETLPVSEQLQSAYFTTFGETPIGIKGAQMLINLWIKHLLTPRGSDYTDLSYGSVFPSLIGSTVSVADAKDVLILAISQTNDYIFEMQALDATLTASERLESATLITYIEDPSGPGFEAYVELKNQAGEIAVVPVPRPIRSDTL